MSGRVGTLKEIRDTFYSGDWNKFLKDLEERAKQSRMNSRKKVIKEDIEIIRSLIKE